MTRKPIPNSISIAENVEVFLKEHNLPAAAAESATRSAHVAHQCSCRNTDPDTGFWACPLGGRFYSCTEEDKPMRFGRFRIHAEWNQCSAATLQRSSTRKNSKADSKLDFNCRKRRSVPAGTLWKTQSAHARYVARHECLSDLIPTLYP